MVLKKLLMLVLLITLSSLVYASGEIAQFADRLNYWNGTTHTVTVTNNGALATQVNLTIPSGFVYSSGTCTNPAAGTIQCDIPAGSSRTYIVNSSGANAEYTISSFTPVTNNSYTGNSVQFIKIRSDEIFHTLVEFGRGRGNYFFDTYGGGAYAGTGHTGTGCSYLPNGSMFELNFLHKINNIKQYFGDLSALAYNATFSCIYPNDTVIRQHLVTSIVTNNSGAYVNYLIPKIEGSWDRMGYLGMDFEAFNNAAGKNITISCTNMSYYFPVAGGNFYVGNDSFTLHVVNREPFTATAAAYTTLGNGTQEVIITYNITNNGLSGVDGVVIEIQAPPYSTFIGTRGELWGSALDQYRIEKAHLAAGESEIVQLVARFDTTNAPNLTAVNLTNGIKIQYVTCWELNAYNPNEYIQLLRSIGNITVNMGTPTTIVNITDVIIKIYNLTVTINNTVTSINNTVNQISIIVNVINATTNETNIIVKAINSTSNQILNQSLILVNNTNIILNDTHYIIDLLNCNGTVDTPLCNKIRSINNSVYNLYNFSLYLNYTAHHLNITVIENINFSGVNVSVYLDLSNLTKRLREIKESINCSNLTAQPNSSVCNTVARIENNTIVINNTINSIYNMTNYFNTTVFGNFTFKSIVDSIDNVSAQISYAINRMVELRAFSEEIVFLITDAFGLQQNAKEDFLKGDVGSAFTELSDANVRLQKAADLLAQEQSSLSAEEGSFDAKWVLIGMIVIIVGAMLIFLFGKAPPDKKGRASLGILKLLPAIALLLLCTNFACADFGPRGTITQTAQNLNFGNTTDSMTVDVYYNCSGQRVFNVTFPAGFSVSFTGAPCGMISSTKVSCNFDDNPFSNHGWYYFTGSNLSDHTVFVLPTTLSNTTNCSITNNITVLKIPDDEIFYTLVEYGRGRGNYFYSSKDGTAGSGHTEKGCSYIPNGTMFELNFLHKIFNVNQWYDEANAVALNATFTCSYPNNTIVRSHLGRTIVQNGSSNIITYYIDQLDSSWERMGYVGIQFDPSEQYVGENLTIHCYNISYYYPTQNGYVTINKNNTTFILQVRNPRPFIATATTTSLIGNGTQEVLITYNITNNEVYSADNVVIEIQAPPYSTFIGTRGELWGSALDQYRIEKMSLAPGESEIIQLVARFDTTNAPNLTSLNLANGIKIQYVTCWDLNAYNPAESIQIVYNTGNATVNMSIPSTIIDIRQKLIEIYNTTTIINSTTTAINNTVNLIQSVVITINSTTFETNTIVKEINYTVNNILNNVTVALNNTYSIIYDTSYIKDLLNCNGTIDTPMCSWLDDVNSTLNNMSNVFFEINQTLHNLSINITIDLAGQNITMNITPDLTNITIIIDDIMSELNCTMNWTTEPNASLCKTLARIENNTIVINNSVNNVNNMVNYFNTTVFGNYTLEYIWHRINDLSINISTLITEINRMETFDEELVFLVTDAFGLQQSAEKDFTNGDLGAAAAKLKEANIKLNQAADRLESQRTLGEDDLTGATETDYTWALVFMAGILVVGLLVYLVSKPHEE